MIRFDGGSGWEAVQIVIDASNLCCVTSLLHWSRSGRFPVCLMHQIDILVWLVIFKYIAVCHYVHREIMSLHFIWSCNKQVVNLQVDIIWPPIANLLGQSSLRIATRRPRRRVDVYPTLELLKVFFFCFAMCDQNFCICLYVCLYVGRIVSQFTNKSLLLCNVIML